VRSNRNESILSYQPRRQVVPLHRQRNFPQENPVSPDAQGPARPVPPVHQQACHPQGQQLHHRLLRLRQRTDQGWRRFWSPNGLRSRSLIWRQSQVPHRNRQGPSLARGFQAWDRQISYSTHFWACWYESAWKPPGYLATALIHYGAANYLQSACRCLAGGSACDWRSQGWN